jgi:hypothetical protein
MKTYVERDVHIQAPADLLRSPSVGLNSMKKRKTLISAEKRKSD